MVETIKKNVKSGANEKLNLKMNTQYFSQAIV